ncbi:hypothetical protein KJQ97_06865 [Campylobacter sp. 2018MI01]|uniref:HP0268 family nuclease n=1 Tax=Campylobacter sp. 2018MI01 TaxID=2836735 RepID=UPI001BDA6687|nr:HP0268 family nuclease [Campylobacter sp. 2018MI01]MBT0879137.1 hypothetical protein [Campylobacter sp. 2018MI01]
MKFKLAKQTLNSKPKEVTIEEVIKILEEKKVIFLDHSNSSEDITKLVEKLNKFKVYVNTVKYGLVEDEFIYEVHIL